MGWWWCGDIGSDGAWDLKWGDGAYAIDRGAVVGVGSVVVLDGVGLDLNGDGFDGKGVIEVVGELFVDGFPVGRDGE